jgi:hypothetical protein
MICLHVDIALPPPLQDFTPREMEDMAVTLHQAADVVRLVLTQGVDKAVSQANPPTSKPAPPSKTAAPKAQAGSSTQQQPGSQQESPQQQQQQPKAKAATNMVVAAAVASTAARS